VPKQEEPRYVPLDVIAGVAERLGYRTPAASSKFIDPISLLLGFVVGRQEALLLPANRERLEFLVEQTLGSNARRRRAEAHERLCSPKS
jgi:hypothetical protein